MVRIAVKGRHGFVDSPCSVESDGVDLDAIDGVRMVRVAVKGIAHVEGPLVERHGFVDSPRSVESEGLALDALDGVRMICVAVKALARLECFLSIGERFLKHAYLSVRPCCVLE